MARAVAFGALAALAMAGPAFGDAATSVGDSGVRITDGAALYQHICQGCHMPGGRGAVGAGAFPKLAGDPKLVAANYPVMMVLNGHGAMPWFNGVLSDVQIANVVNFVRGSFGNSYPDKVTPADVAALRGPPPHMER